MKGTLHIGRGKLVIDGEVVATYPRTTVELDVDLDALESVVRGGKGGDVEVGVSTSDEGQTELLNPNGGESEGGTRDELGEAIDFVWNFYRTTMKPRRADATPEDRAIIRNALKVATGQTQMDGAKELNRAIYGCSTSDFHMGKNDKQRKYNKLGQILKGRRGRNETTRDRIDFFLDLADKADLGVSSVPSASREIVLQHVGTIRRAHRVPDNEEAQAKAKQAQEWLQTHGYEVIRDGNGYPRFHQRGVNGGGTA